MPHSSHMDQLNQAVQKEISDEQLRINRCDDFLEKIIRYQNGQGELPDEQQFLLWREDLKRTMTLRALKSAIDMPDEGADAAGGTHPEAQAGRSPGRDRSTGGMGSPAF
jgi:hypothetical protein